MIHINPNTIFYTHIEHSPTETIYIRYYVDTHTHSDCSKNWVLVGVEILWEEEGLALKDDRVEQYLRSYGSEF